MIILWYDNIMILYEDLALRKGSYNITIVMFIHNTHNNIAHVSYAFYAHLQPLTF